MTKEEITTIKLSKKTKERLNNLRAYKNETFEEILVRVFDILNSLKTSPVEAKSKLDFLEQQRKRNPS